MCNLLSYEHTADCVNMRRCMCTLHRIFPATQRNIFFTVTPVRSVAFYDHKNLSADALQTERCCLAGYELANRAEAHWNDLTLAMYMLVHAAVHNPVNAFFVLLSEACVPLYPAAAVYLEVIHEPRSRLAGVHAPLLR